MGESWRILEGTTPGGFVQVSVMYPEFAYLKSHVCFVQSQFLVVMT
jgi:hypothetical protein